MIDFARYRLRPVPSFLPNEAFVARKNFVNTKCFTMREFVIGKMLKELFHFWIVGLLGNICLKFERFILFVYGCPKSHQ